jgi:hypothetical protein
MPQIIVTADRGSERDQGAETLRERINSSDFECATFASRLVERLGWAVDDAHAAERAAPEGSPTRPDTAPQAEPAQIETPVESEPMEIRAESNLTKTPA